MTVEQALRQQLNAALDRVNYRSVLEAAAYYLCNGEEAADLRDIVDAYEYWLECQENGHH